MLLNHLTTEKLKQDPFLEATYQGFSIAVEHPSEESFILKNISFIPNKAVDDSMICIFLSDENSKEYETLDELKTDAKNIIKNFPYKAKVLESLWKQRGFTFYHPNTEDVVSAIKKELS